jgi:hypothetical protein
LTEIAKCSRAGCDSAAENLIEWRNPKIHEPDRVKRWAGCSDHTEFLIEYLKARDFFLRTREIETKHD